MQYKIQRTAHSALSTTFLFHIHSQHEFLSHIEYEMQTIVIDDTGVCQSVCNASGLCQNGWTNPRTGWKLLKTQKHCISPYPPRRGEGGSMWPSSNYFGTCSTYNELSSLLLNTYSTCIFLNVFENYITQLKTVLQSLFTIDSNGEVNY